MAVHSTDFTKKRQRLDKPSPAENAMNPNPRPRRLWWVLGLVLLAGTAIGARYVLNGSGSPGDPNSGDVTPPGVLAPALIDNAKGVVQLRALGRVVWIIDEGAVVEKHTVLLKLDSEREQAQLKQAEADQKAAEAQLEEAQNAEKSFKFLVEQQQNVVKAAKEAMEIAAEDYQRILEANKIQPQPKQDVKKAELNRDMRKSIWEGEEAKLRALKEQKPELKVTQAEAIRDAKKGQVTAAKWALDQTEVKAPEKGKVLRVQAHVAEWLTTNTPTPAIWFAPEGGLIARAEVLQEWADRVHVGQEVLIESEPRTKQQWRGHVRSVSDWFTQKRNPMLEPFTFNDVRTLECIIDIPQGAGPAPRIGQRVRIVFLNTTK